MLQSIFINKQGELSLLNQRFGRPSAEFVVIYGRRRIGKSELIDQFINNRNKRFLAREE
ncbi:MAG: ATP-binding protein [Methanosarcinaceae archaeon]|nr:ATP-binding protein [Methanosarcinaceae archaeon]